MKNNWILGALIMLTCHYVPAAEKISEKSPNGDLELTFSLDDNGRAFYSASYLGQSIIKPSSLGFEFKDQAALNRDLKLVTTSRTDTDETWEQPWGEERFIRNHYQQLQITLQESSGAHRKFNLVFRLYDDGLGFRYELDAFGDTREVAITSELTEFNLGDNHQAWWTPAQAGNQYEYLYQHSDIKDAPLIHTPVTLETKGGLYLALHEAALADYSTMNLQGNGSFNLKAELVPLTPHTNVKANVQLPFKTPWRTLMVAEQPGDLITNYLTLNLNEPNALGDVSWVKPGKYVGIWWELHLEKGTWKQGPKHGATTANTKKYIDFAAKHDFDGVLVEGWNEGWDSEWFNGQGADFNFTKAYPDYDVDAVTAYAKKNGVYIIGHHETGAAVDNYESQLDDAYQFLQDHGMLAVKTGYVETGERLTNGYYHQGQRFVEHAMNVTKTAAKHNIMVVAHETVKDTGERRTYPNLLSREVARGQEYDAWSDDGGNPPSHTAIIPYTRLLSGPMDFTPGAFELTLPTRPNNQVNTTLAKQLALYVVIYSPVQMASDLPENYEAHLDAFQFIKDVPVDWETTRVLSGEIGESIAIARQERNGNDWYVGALTNEKPRTTTLDLDFLTPGKHYQARIYKDAPDAHYHDNPGAYTIEERDVTAGDSLNIDLAAGGGVAISLKQQ
ncbi:glycoside hydrolase family 97 protein [Gilvimarinus japonicus]|uniref:Glycoside hydrolase family 97 protein n=1 Tax=Gilvimarinus japonicus TaxID=1796469 RepID=A0ABV7HKQ5_9GAMM